METLSDRQANTVFHLNQYLQERDSSGDLYLAIKLIDDRLTQLEFITDRRLAQIEVLMKKLLTSIDKLP